jgi:hypothetical protein
MNNKKKIVNILIKYILKKQMNMYNIKKIIIYFSTYTQPTIIDNMDKQYIIIAVEPILNA